MKTITNEMFCRATTAWNCGDESNEIAWICEPEDVVTTSESIEDFIRSRGKFHDTVETESGVLMAWEGQQARPGKKKGNLFLLDAGDRRLSYFDGAT